MGGFETLLDGGEFSPSGAGVEAPACGEGETQRDASCGERRELGKEGHERISSHENAAQGGGAGCIVLARSPIQGPENHGALGVSVRLSGSEDAVESL